MSEQDVDAAPTGRALGADLVIPALAAGLTIYFFVDSAELVWEARANGTVIGVALLAMIVAHRRHREGHRAQHDLPAKFRSADFTACISDFTRSQVMRADRVAGSARWLPSPLLPFWARPCSWPGPP